MQYFIYIFYVASILTFTFMAGRNLVRLIALRKEKEEPEDISGFGMWVVLDLWFIIPFLCKLSATYL